MIASSHEDVAVVIAAIISFYIDSSSFVEYKGSAIMQIVVELLDNAMVSLV